MTVEEFIDKITSDADSLAFSEVTDLIDTHYHFTPTAFRNGKLNNAAEQNLGSCKVLAFAKRHNLNVEQTLACFGDYYRIDVLQNPHLESHPNIRNFIKFGWEGVEFDNEALIPKS